MSKFSPTTCNSSVVYGIDFTQRLTTNGVLDPIANVVVTAIPNTLVIANTMTNATTSIVSFDVRPSPPGTYILNFAITTQSNEWIFDQQYPITVANNVTIKTQ